MVLHCGAVSRLESQMTSDIQTILQLLQRQSSMGPPAYSTVTASPDYKRPAIRVQPIAAIMTAQSPSQATQVQYSPGHLQGLMPDT